MNGEQRTTSNHIMSLILALIFLTASLIGSGMIGEPVEHNKEGQLNSNDDADPLDLYNSENNGFFIENNGQIENEEILFYCTIGDQSVGFMTNGYLLVNSPKDQDSSVMQVDFDGSNEVEPEGQDPKSFRRNHLTGNDQSQWVTGIHEYEKIVYRDLYQGIDLVFSLSPEGLKYDWIVEPFADPTAIRETYSGIDSIYIDDGSLVVGAGGGNVRQEAPVTYQENDGSRVTIPSNYLIEEGRTVIYDIGDYDQSRELVIDPLIGGTFLGTGDLETIFGVATDTDDNIYVMGYTRSPNFPTTPGTNSPPVEGYDVFVTKFDPLLRELIYSATIGGWRHEVPSAMTVDEDGFAYVVLKTQSDDFPTTNGSYQEELNGSVNTVVFKLNQDGSDLVFSTYIGGNITAEFRDIELDENRNIYLAGDKNNVVLLKLSADGSELLASIEFGGSDRDVTSSITLDEQGNVFIIGSTKSQDFPTTSGCFESEKGGNNLTNSEAYDAYIMKLSGDFTKILYSTFLGGDASDSGGGIAVDNLGCMIVTGSTGSENFTTTPGCINSIYNGSGGMFISKLNPNGSALIYSTYISSNDDKSVWGSEIVLDSKGNACIGGNTYSNTFPTTPGCFQPMNPGGGNHGYGTLIVVIIDPEGSLLYSTYASGASEDNFGGIAVDSQDNIIVAGYFNDGATMLPTFSSCYDPNGHARDGFIVKFNTTLVPNPLMTIDPTKTYLDTESNPLTGVVSSDSGVLRHV